MYTKSSDDPFLNYCPGLYVPSSVFEPCHSVISPGPYVTTCVSDICKNGNNTCTSLEAYATECSNAGVCIDWRNATKGQCGEINNQRTILQLLCGVLENVYMNISLSSRAQVSYRPSVQGLWSQSGADM